jgi:magnesium transporter
MRFGATLEAVTALILFQPMILGQAGNIGTQALAVTILGIHQHALDEKKDTYKHILKESTIGLINGLVVAAIAFIYVTIYLNIFEVGSQEPMKVGFAVFSALLTVMVISSIMGTLVPIILEKINVDPASASGPFMTTINDIVSLVVYFAIATLLFVV